MQLRTMVLGAVIAVGAALLLKPCRLDGQGHAQVLTTLCGTATEITPFSTIRGGAPDVATAPAYAGAVLVTGKVKK